MSLKISLDISLFNLTNQHQQQVSNFVSQLEAAAANNFIVKKTPLSIQIYGDYLPLIQLATQEFKLFLQQQPISGLTIRLGTCPFSVN